MLVEQGSFAFWLGLPGTTALPTPRSWIELAPATWERLHVHAGESLLTTDRRPDPND
jgi:hypothetical protein